MNILYLECKMGAAGDMLTAALYELLTQNQKKEFWEMFQKLNLPEVQLTPIQMEKCGIYGTKMQVLIHHQEETIAPAPAKHHHHHSSYPEIIHQISHFPLSDAIKKDITTIYQRIGEAEAKVHQTTLEQIHFHEVGTLDAIADITASCILMHQLKPDRIYASPIHLGNGTVHCAHGILPVPAPATAEILKGVPCYSGDIMSELCTPTGAALIRHFAADYGPLPPISIAAIGHGMGSKDFPQANCLRAIWGSDRTSEFEDTIVEFTCCIDDMTAEAIGFALETLIAQGALDAYTTAVTMKKSRPGIQLTVLCPPAKEDSISKLIFQHTTTRGIRIQTHKRRILSASYEKVSTPYGEITLKTSHGYGVEHTKPEYDDLAAAARKHQTTLEAIRKTIPAPKI